MHQHNRHNTVLLDCVKHKTVTVIVLLLLCRGLVMSQTTFDLWLIFDSNSRTNIRSQPSLICQHPPVAFRRLHTRDRRIIQTTRKAQRGPLTCLLYTSDAADE